MGTIRSWLIHSSTSHSCMFGHPIKHRLLKLRKLQKTIKLLGRSAPVTHIHTVCIDIARTETPAIVIRSQMRIGRSECAECAEQHIKRRCWLLAAGRCRTDALRRLCQRSQRHVKVLMQALYVRRLEHSSSLLSPSPFLLPPTLPFHSYMAAPLSPLTMRVSR